MDLSISVLKLIVDFWHRGFEVMLAKLTSPPQARKFAILGCTQAGFVNKSGQKYTNKNANFGESVLN